MLLLKWLGLFTLLIDNSKGQYEIPEVNLEAYTPQGFRASIYADKGTKIFGFHGKLNEKMSVIEQGNFSEDIREPKDGYLTYFNPDLKLKLGDTVNYWVYVQHSQYGYRKDDLEWTVTELKPLPNKKCEVSETKISNRQKVCVNDIVLEDKFDGNTLDDNKWTLEQYIPIQPDFEFVNYKDDKTVIYLQNGQLHISPKLLSEQEIHSDPLDLSSGCTRKPSSRAQCKREKYLIQNPLFSGKIVMKYSFLHGNIEVRAKLPVGDWIYPEIYLEDDDDKRILIAFARGNKVLTGNEKIDIGGSLLFGGPIFSHEEPEKSSKLSSSRSSAHFGDDFHVYKTKWSEQGGIELYVDGIVYGKIDASSLSSSGFNSNQQVRLVLGVGVGGATNFPNDYMSGDFPKPWKNKGPKRVKNFYDKRQDWQSTWTKDGAVLLVDYVKITAV